MRVIVSSLVVLCLSITNRIRPCLAQSNERDNEVFLWSSTGGGWRSMFACIGYVNLFRQANLLADDSCEFTAIATNSGAAWFAAQLFYSQAFYQQTVLAASPQDLYQFTIQWMTSYLNLMISVFDDDETDNSPLIDAIEAIANATKDSADNSQVVETLVEITDLFNYFNGDWAQLVGEMLQAAATDYGHEGELNVTRADPEGRLLALRNTDMLMQIALAPTGRVRTTTDAAETDTGIYLGPTTTDTDDGPPNNSNMDLYTVALSTAYIVNATYTGFQYATFDSPSSGQVNAYDGLLSTEFAFDTWDTFFLYPESSSAGLGNNNNNEDPSVLISGSTVLGGSMMSPPSQDSTMTMPLPFGGDPEGAMVVQITASSSADAGKVSPLLPSIFAQTFSQTRATIRANGTSAVNLARLAAFDGAVAALYNSPLLDQLAVCAQWPTPCGPTDGLFLDGGFVDNPSVAINIAQYHQRQDANLTKTIKLVVTNTNGAFIQNSTSTQALFLQYFETDFNRGIDPGQFVWIPGSSVPRRSPQFLQESLSADQLIAALQPIDDSNMSTAILQGTTMANEAFGILEGQDVEILLLNLNQNIPTVIVGTSSINANTVPLAEMTQQIASNEELLRRIQDFFGTQQGPPGPLGVGESGDMDMGVDGGEAEMGEGGEEDTTGGDDASSTATDPPIGVDDGDNSDKDNDNDNSDGGSGSSGNNVGSSSWKTARQGMWVAAAALLYAATIVV